MNSQPFPMQLSPTNLAKVYSVCSVGNTSLNCVYIAQYLLFFKRVTHTFQTADNRIIKHAIAKLWKAAISFVVSVRHSVRLFARHNTCPTVQIFIKFGIWVFFEHLSRKLKCHLNHTRITGTLHEEQYAFLNISLSVLLRMRNVPDKICRENPNIYFISELKFFEKRVIYKTMRKTV